MCPYGVKTRWHVSTTTNIGEDGGMTSHQKLKVWSWMQMVFSKYLRSTHRQYMVSSALLKPHTSYFGCGPNLQLHCQTSSCRMWSGAMLGDRYLQGCSALCHTGALEEWSLKRIQGKNPTIIIYFQHATSPKMRKDWLDQLQTVTIAMHCLHARKLDHSPSHSMACSRPHYDLQHFGDVGARWPATQTSLYLKAPVDAGANNILNVNMYLCAGLLAVYFPLCTHLTRKFSHCTECRAVHALDDIQMQAITHSHPFLIVFLFFPPEYCIITKHVFELIKFVALHVTTTQVRPHVANSRTLSSLSRAF